jgi:hypothetical protein
MPASESASARELLDIAAHHSEHDHDWFGGSVTKTQPTWQKLIWLLFAIKAANGHRSWSSTTRRLHSPC